mmetsp:Transcript_12704/g.41575  ORF Transcript_12704/g.41575 Transcript_12704/m.41575 type:complete len:296 (-) Transcript_12704:352-1239(-)
MEEALCPGRHGHRGRLRGDERQAQGGPRDGGHHPAPLHHRLKHLDAAHRRDRLRRTTAGEHRRDALFLAGAQDAAARSDHPRQDGAARGRGRRRGWHPAGQDGDRGQGRARLLRQPVPRPVSGRGDGAAAAGGRPAQDQSGAARLWHARRRRHPLRRGWHRRLAPRGAQPRRRPPEGIPGRPDGGRRPAHARQVRRGGPARPQDGQGLLRLFGPEGQGEAHPQGRAGHPQGLPAPGQGRVAALIRGDGGPHDAPVRRRGHPLPSVGRDPQRARRRRGGRHGHRLPAFPRRALYVH